MSNKEKLSPEMDSLLRDMRSYLANSNDPWDQRRDLIQRLNDLVTGGEVDLFIATVREMGRMGMSYANMMQTFTQLMPGTGVPNIAEMFTKGFAPTAAFAPNMFVNPAALDFMRQMTEFMSHSNVFTPGKK